jgi:NADH:ubiquinone oxidoreductase subunit 5 (subunit L)/multisubunit Na+/H+ antiporter MnhA subunit
MVKNRVNFTEILFMSRSSKLFVGLISFVPIILLIIFFIFFFRFFDNIFVWSGYEPEPREVFDAFRPMFMLAIIMSLISLGLLAFFIIHVIQNKKIESTEKIVWVLVFFFASIVGFPVYWYMRIWHDQPL